MATNVFLIIFLFQYLPKIYHSVCFLRRMQNVSGYIFGTIWWGIALNLIAYLVAAHVSSLSIRSVCNLLLNLCIYSFHNYWRMMIPISSLLASWNSWQRFLHQQAVGGCWYLLGIQRATKCLNEQCVATKGCGDRTVGCISPIYYGTDTAIKDSARLDWANNISARSTCLGSSKKYDYGAFKWAVLLFTNTSRIEKILLPLLWGLMTLRYSLIDYIRNIGLKLAWFHLDFSTFGGALECTANWPEIVFNIIVITTGLLLVTMLIGNIKVKASLRLMWYWFCVYNDACMILLLQVFLHSTTSKKQSVHLKMQSLDWWMRRRKLPQGIRQRVRQYERQRWAAMRGVDECQMIRNLPDGLRRDIKYQLCLDLVRQVSIYTRAFSTWLYMNSYLVTEL